MEDQGNSGNQGAHDIIIDDNVLGEFKDHPAFQSFKGQPIGKVLKSIDNAHRLTEGQIVLPKGKNDTPENWDRLYDKLGRPKDASGYVFDKRDLPPGLRHDKGLERAFAAECHKLGILPKQARALHEFYSKQVEGAADAWLQDRDKQYGEAHAYLHEQHGNNVDLVIREANRVLCQFGGTPEEVQAIVEEYGNNPALINVLYNVGKMMAEAPLVKGEKLDRFDNRGSAASLKKAILYDKNHPLNAAYTDKKHPYHDEAVKKVLELNTLLHGIQEED